MKKLCCAVFAILVTISLSGCGGGGGGSSSSGGGIPSSGGGGSVPATSTSLAPTSNPPSIPSLGAENKQYEAPALEATPG